MLGNTVLPSGGSGRSLDDSAVGAMEPAGDEDWLSLAVVAPYASVVLDVFDLGDGACAQGEMNPAIELVAGDGVTVLGGDDDSGEGYCARAEVMGLASGSYALHVWANGAAPPVFPYRLQATVHPCGDGVRSGPEERDDGNNDGGGGCGSECRIEALGAQ